VAGFTCAAIGPEGKLASMNILVAVCAPGSCFDVDLPDPGRRIRLHDMAERARSGLVLSPQWKTGRAVVETGNQRRLPGLLRVTHSALTPVLS
jgi:hypothetical protein